MTTLSAAVAQEALGLIPWKQTVRLVATTNQMLLGLPTIDSTLASEGDEVLLTAQTAPAENGPWVVSANAWARRSDMNNSTEVTLGLMWKVREGVALAGSIWSLTAPSGPITLNSTSLTIAQFGTFVGTALATPNTTMARDGSAGTAVAFVKDASASPATLGVLRVGNAVTAVMAHNVAGDANIKLAGTDSSNNAVYGDQTNTAGIIENYKTGGFWSVAENGTEIWRFNKSGSNQRLLANGLGVIEATTSVQLQATSGIAVIQASQDVYVSALSSSVLTFAAEVHQTGGSSTKVRYEGSPTVQTTDATVTTLATYTLPDNTTVLIEANIIGDVVSGANSAGYRRIATVKRTGGGAATLVGAVDTTYTAEDNAAWDATIDVPGTNDVRVRVTGAAATTINWICFITIYRLT